MQLNSSDQFYFYQSSIGRLEKLVMKYVLTDITPTPGFVTNAFGVKVNPKHLPLVVGDREGVEAPPIPANWHADLAEFGAALRALDLARKKFTVVELGCGWGCWLNITGVVARQKGLDVTLIGVEGDPGHVQFAHEALTENGFNSGDYVVHHGIASWQEGHALFPIQEHSGVSWGLEARFNVSDDELVGLLETGKYMHLRQIPLSSLLPQDCDHIDLVHVDIQGAEIPLIPASMEFLNEKVAMVLIGTHSKQIEAALFDSFLSFGWVLEVERPAVLSVGRKLHTKVDGVQLWRNPRLLHDSNLPLCDPEDYAGNLDVKSIPESVSADQKFSVEVIISNISQKNWNGFGECPIHISYHWRSDSGEIIIFDGIRTNLANNFIALNSNVSQMVDVVAPASIGIFSLELTLVHEANIWFETADFDSCIIKIQVCE
ncbi:class I SAM-dependent methyltransferase [Rhodoferax sp. GW822-FHT02A01]|uniref:class I SAM-dependent methyltransferase n=1 Tax=Rhodoferax sp. GW822-FHT02A01 TaxID=3141537 RepID=UPI00315C4C60